MIKKYSWSDKKLAIESNTGQKYVIEFETPIRDALLYRSALIVHVGNNVTYLCRNIFRVSEDGKIVWQVQHPFEFRNIKSDSSAAFTYLGLKNEKIIGGSMDCFTYEIDFETGKLSNPVFTK